MLGKDHAAIRAFEASFGYVKFLEAQSRRAEVVHGKPCPPHEVERGKIPARGEAAREMWISFYSGHKRA
jgi:hypothetical protein